jgi:hypothetical protein
MSAPKTEFTRIDEVLQQVKLELQRATKKFSAFRNMHEGYAVLLEEVDELWELVKCHDHPPGSQRLAQTEAEQIAAMAVRFILDCCQETSTLSASPAPVVPSVVKPPSSQVTLSPGEDSTLDDALADYQDRVRKGKTLDGRVCYYWHYTPDKTIWMDVNAIFKEFGWAWVSDKRNSRWEAPP